MEKNDTRKLIRAFLIAGMAVFTLFVVHIFLLLSGTEPGTYGLVPRSWAGLWGILTAPFVHADWSHLLGNSAPLFVMVAASLYFYRKAFLRSLPWMFLMTGAWVWMAGHGGAHIGASGIVYALAGFLFFSGVFRRDTRSIALSLVIAFFYGGMIWGVLPDQPGISWESHLFGGVAGIVLAAYFRKLDVTPPKRYSWDREQENPQQDAQAIWNYRENWNGSKVMVMPTDPESVEAGTGTNGQFSENHYI